MRKKIIPDFHVRENVLSQNIAHSNPLPSKKINGPLLVRNLYHS